MLPKHEVTVGAEKIKPGMNYLHTLRLNGLSIGDLAIMELLKVTKSIEHIELAKCSNITEGGINKLIESCENLMYIDMNGIPAITYPFLDDIVQRKPELMMKRHKYQDVDFRKDNGLRIPRLIIGAKKKKGKKGKGKKKKK